MDTGELLAIITGVLGLSGLVFTALRYNRDDSKAIVEEQSNVLKDMAALNTSLKDTVADLRTERDNLQIQVRELSAQVARLDR